MAMLLTRDGEQIEWYPTTDLICSACRKPLVVCKDTLNKVNFTFDYRVPDPLEHGEYWYLHKGNCSHVETMLQVRWGWLCMWSVLGFSLFGKPRKTKIQAELQERMPTGMYDRLYSQWLPAIPPHGRLKLPLTKTVITKVVEEPHRPGHVYILLAEGTTRVKIGRTMNMPYRLDALQTASPYPLRTLRTIKANDAVSLETKLHQRYRKYRKHNEWFELPSEVLQQLLTEDFV